MNDLRKIYSEKYVPIRKKCLWAAFGFGLLSSQLDGIGDFFTSLVLIYLFAEFIRWFVSFITGGFTVDIDGDPKTTDDQYPKGSAQKQVGKIRRWRKRSRR